MATYEYVCPSCGSRYTRRDMPVECAAILCDACGIDAPRVPFYLDTAVTRLPTRGPIIPSAPVIRSTKDENTDTWKEVLDEYAHDTYQHDKKYGRGGELADRWDEKPKGERDAN